MKQIMSLFDVTHYAFTRFVILLFSPMLLISCGGGDDSTPLPPKIVVGSCSFAAGDNTQKLDGSTRFIKSHTLGSPVYRIVNTRQLANEADVSMDYMVHEPAGTVKGIMVLIAGGGLNARITGTDGSQPTNSSGNYVVRSAHRYQAAGYRVITLDRPSDYASYGPFNVDLDTYRNSVMHAVDLATVLKRENTEGLNVLILGTSRGAISAVALNSLAAGISISSPLVGGATGSPIGSTKLPLSRIVRNSHILLHTNDTCAVTLPADARTLFDDLNTAGISVSGNEVTGGFRDTVRDDVCGAFDFHGFNGIETCAVQKETTWADSVMSGLGVNKAPLANILNVKVGDSISLTAADADVADTLRYAVPFNNTSLGGTVSTDVDGAVTYTPPGGITAGVIDTFAYTVTDGNGGVGSATVSILF